MPTLSSRTIRRLAVVAILPLAAIAASCTPEPPTCPTLENGHWSGTWTSEVYTDLGGGVEAEMIATATTVGGTVILSGTVLDQPVVLTGSISCNQIDVVTASGISVSGTISPDGDSIEGTYTSTSPVDNGTISIGTGLAES